MPERAASGGPEFDPTTVPPFPVLTLHADEDLDAVTLDGAPIVPMEGQTVREAGIDAIVRRLEAQQLEAVRVRITTPAAEEWRMVVPRECVTAVGRAPSRGAIMGQTCRVLAVATAMASVPAHETRRTPLRESGAPEADHCGCAVSGWRTVSVP